MVTGECPNCDEIVHNAMPDRSPAFAHPTCEHCGKRYWIKLSRIDSEAYTEEEFARLYVVDEEARSITLRTT